MRAVFLIPYRGDGGRRDELWAFVENWLRLYHGEWPIILGLQDEGPFNRGAARNNAARVSFVYDPDVYIFHDADTICDPGMLRQAVARAYETRGCVYPFDTYIYLDEFSTDRLMNQNNWFVCPERRLNPDGTMCFDGVIRRHSGGVQVLAREAYDAIGGYLELDGWGHEDFATRILIETFVESPIEYLDGGAYHLWHPGVRTFTNYQILGDILALSMVPDQLKAYLRDGGHPI